MKNSASLPHILLAKTDDWIAVVVDGVVKHENHSIDPDELLDALGISYSEVYIEDQEEAEAFFAELHKSSSPGPVGI